MDSWDREVQSPFDSFFHKSSAETMQILRDMGVL